MRIGKVTVATPYVEMRIENVADDKAYVKMTIGNATVVNSFVFVRMDIKIVDCSYVRMRVIKINCRHAIC